MFLGVVKFDELVEDLGISRNLLATRLKSLTQGGIIARRAYQQHPPRFAYGLTGAGRELVPAILALTEWGDRWARPREGIPILFVHNACGHQFRPQVICSECGEVIDPNAVTAIPGPGGAPRKGTMIVAKRLAANARSLRDQKSTIRSK